MHNELVPELLPYLSNPVDLSESSQNQKTILLVDDDPDLRSLTRTFLHHEGYRVHCCGTPERARQIFCGTDSNSSIDLLITDLYMPNQSGMDLAFDLKALRRDLPVLIITGGFLGAEHRKQLQNTGWSLLSKPFAFPELLAAVHRMLNEGATLSV